MTSTQKKNPGGQAGARNNDSRSDQKLPKASARERRGPGPRFWLKTDDSTGEELAFEREPGLPHLTVDVVPHRGFERTRTVTLRVRDSFHRQGWKTESEHWGWDGFSSVSWRRPLSDGWERVKANPRLGRVWRRLPPAKGGES